MTTLGFYCLNNPSRRRDELQQMLLVVQGRGVTPFYQLLVYGAVFV